MTELLHPWVLAVALLLVAALCAAVVRRDRSSRRPVPVVAHADRLTALPAYRRAHRRHRAALAVATAAAVVAVVGCAVLTARPVTVVAVDQDSRSRDVVLCLDVSSSMAPTDAAVLDAFARIARDSPGDRIGLVLFDSRPVQVFPLTDDADYVSTQLAKVRAAYDTANVGSPAWAGTTGGEGTSVIGDGAATCVSAFDRLDSPRSRSVVLATDDIAGGPQRVTLDDVGRLALARGVRLYGLNPAAPTTDTARAAAQRFQAAVTLSGGTYAEVTSPGAVPGVVTGLRAREAARATGTPRLVPVDASRTVGVVVGAAVLVLLVARALAGGRPARRGAVVTLVLVGLSAVLVWAPTVPGGTSALRSRDVDVYLVVDGTLSMAAEDGAGGRTRLSEVQADVGELTRRYAGARFSTIVSSSTALQTMPLTTDTAAALTSVESLVPSSAGSAQGGDPRQASALLYRLLSAGARQAPGRAQLVFYFGDGEATRPASAGRFSADGAGGGAVLGYGTATGGPMRDAPLVGGESTYVPDTRPGHLGNAISREDRKTLQGIADELGVPFVQRTGSTGFDAVVADAVPGRLRPVRAALGSGTPLSWIVAGVLLVVLAADGVHWWTRRRS